MAPRRASRQLIEDAAAMAPRLRGLAQLERAPCDSRAHPSQESRSSGASFRFSWMQQIVTNVGVGLIDNRTQQSEHHQQQQQQIAVTKPRTNHSLLNPLMSRPCWDSLRRVDLVHMENSEAVRQESMTTRLSNESSTARAAQLGNNIVLFHVARRTTSESRQTSD